jgi:hypothetical protein
LKEKERIEGKNERKKSEIIDIRNELKERKKEKKTERTKKRTIQLLLQSFILLRQLCKHLILFCGSFLLYSQVVRLFPVTTLSAEFGSFLYATLGTSRCAVEHAIESTLLLCRFTVNEGEGGEGEGGGRRRGERKK